MSDLITYSLALGLEATANPLTPHLKASEPTRPSSVLITNPQAPQPPKPLPNPLSPGHQILSKRRFPSWLQIANSSPKPNPLTWFKVIKSLIIGRLRRIRWIRRSMSRSKEYRGCFVMIRTIFSPLRGRRMSWIMVRHFQKKNYPQSQRTKGHCANPSDGAAIWSRNLSRTASKPPNDPPATSPSLPLTPLRKTPLPPFRPNPCRSINSACSSFPKLLNLSPVQSLSWTRCFISTIYRPKRSFMCLKTRRKICWWRWRIRIRVPMSFLWRGGDSMRPPRRDKRSWERPGGMTGNKKHRRMEPSRTG